MNKNVETKNLPEKQCFLEKCSQKKLYSKNFRATLRPYEHSRDAEGF